MWTLARAIRMCIVLLWWGLPSVCSHAQVDTLSPVTSGSGDIGAVSGVTGPVSNDTSVINGTRLAVVAGGVAAVITGIHVYQSYGWWKNNRAPFHFREDLRYGLYVDKLGHLYGSIAIAFVMRKSFEWVGFPEEKAVWWGSGSALLFQTYVEVEDGFSTWGFDRVDFAGDVAGAAWPVGQYYVPFLREFDFKFSYHPSPILDMPGGTGFQGQKHIMFDDYEGQTIWLSVNPKSFLPASLAPYWPGFLRIAAGYGARDVLSDNPYRVWFLALDYDMTRIIPGRTGFLKTLGEALNFIHFPAPAIRLSPSTVWYGLYF